MQWLERLFVTEYTLWTRGLQRRHDLSPAILMSAIKLWHTFVIIATDNIEYLYYSPKLTPKTGTLMLSLLDCHPNC